MELAHKRQFNWRTFFVAAEEWIGIASLLALCVIPILQSIVRSIFGGNIPDSGIMIRHLILPITFLGASLASRHRQHLGISLGLHERKDWLGAIGSIFPAFFLNFIVVVFFVASLTSIFQFDIFNKWAWFIPLGPVFLILPIGYLMILYRQRPHKATSQFFRLEMVAMIAGLIFGLWYSLADARDLLVLLGIDASASEAFFASWAAIVDSLKTPIIILLVLSTFAGTPLFVVLGGVAALCFTGSAFYGAQGAASIINSGYTLITDANMPAIALFTFTGFLISGGKAGERLVRLFKAVFAPIPGGIVIVTVVASAFFTTFTGATGVTILALGGLLYTILMKSGHNTERFSVGLLTASGTIGLLFPPSLAIILYGAISGVDIGNLFMAGLLPGTVLLVAMIVGGILLSHKESRKRESFDGKEILAALKDAWPELLLPVIIVVLFFSGVCVLSETAAWAALYAFIVEVVVRREIGLRAFRQIGVKSLVIVGGVLIILAVARGINDYLVLMDVPATLVNWMSVNVQSPFVFLLLLNVLLLIVGCFMDLYSAILIVVPLIIPIATSYGIAGEHLAMIFLSNLGVGFLTPPVGMNLFLSAFRFERPLVKIYRDILPYLIIQFIVVLLITYFPYLWKAIVG